MATPPLEITTLGRSLILYGGQSFGDTLLKKAQALLVYLAANPGPHTRQALAGLLWSDLPEEKARANLRTALSRLRSSFGEAILTTQQSAAIHVAAGVWLDAANFEQGLKSSSPQARREAISLYRGDFLADFSLRGADLFEDWVIIERERLRQLALNGLSELASLAQQSGSLPQAVADLQRLLQLDPWRETAHRRLMRLYAESGDRAAALAQFETCREQLSVQLGVEPEPATLALYEQIKSGTLRVPRQPSGSLPSNLPAPTSSFHGRAGEKAQIAAALADPGCRLLTLTGLGGVGKTRLAIETLHDLAQTGVPQFQDGLWFVPLAGADSQAGMVTAVAAATGFTFSGPKEPHEQLFAYLHSKHVLLLLDNFEHLVAFAPLLVDLLQRTPRVKLLVTSRERLNLYEEWTLSLDGLPFPDEEEDRQDDFDAVQLFAQRARRVNLAFNLGREAAGVAQICRVVEGLPLGIELAASWMRSFSAQEIAAAIQSNLGELASSPDNLPERHRSLQATFDYSWALLTNEEQSVLANLAVFRGGFQRDAAGQVAGATNRLLANLVEKSLLRRAETGRYEMHEQLRQYAWEKLPSAGQEAAHRRHMAYFAGFSSARKAALTAPGQDTALAAIQADFDNLHAAWQHAISSWEYSALEVMADVLFHYSMKRGLQIQGYRTFGEAVAALQISTLDPTNPRAAALLGKLLVFQGRCGEFVSKDLSEPRALLQQGLALAAQHGLYAEQAQAQLGLGLLSLVSGQRQQAAENLQASIDLSQEYHLDWVLGSACSLRAWVHNADGETEQAMDLCAQALATQRASGDANGIAGTLTTLGKIHTDRQDYLQAEQAYREALEICRQSGHRVGAAQALTGLFGASFRMGDFEKAAGYARESLAVNQDAGDRLGEAIAYHNLGVVLQSQENHLQAIEHFQQALNIYHAIGADERRMRNTQDYLTASLNAGASST